MKGEFRYTSKLIAIPIITIFLSMLLILGLPGKVKLILFLSFFLCFLFIWILENTPGNFEANETEVKFVTLGKGAVIEFKDIKKIEIKNEQVCGNRGPCYYRIYLEIVTSNNIYEYT